MRTFWSPTHRRHQPANEIIDGHLQPHVEVPARADLVLAAVSARGLGEVVEVAGASAADRAAVEQVHDPAYVRFLEGAWSAWMAEGRDWDALPMVWPLLGADTPEGRAEPENIDARLGHWSFDAGTPITEGTWDAANASAATALAGARDVLGGARSAFALCRPPGHHAMAGAYGGYCYLNNSAIAAQALRDGGAGRVAVLDVDYHHGNGTQAIFWPRPDVLTVSIHADPRQEYPYFLGFASETGGPGAEGTNRNLPLPWGTGFDGWGAALDDAIDTVRSFGADALVVPLGVDTHEADPISRFRLRTDDYLAIGARLASLDLPTLVVLEGGYATDVIGTNVANVLEGLVSFVGG